MKSTFDKTRSLILVPAMLHGPDRAVAVRMGLDTGATKTCLSMQSLNRVGYFVDPLGKTSLLNTGNGLIQVSVVEIEALRCLGRTKFHLNARCHAFPSNLGIDGLLGLDFFEDSDLHIDFRNGTIELL